MLQSCFLIQVRKILWRLTISFFATNSPRFFSCLAILCMTLFEEPSPQFQFSIQTNFISLSMICPSACLIWSKSLRLASTSDSSWYNFSLSHSLLGRPSQHSVQWFWRFSLFQRIHDVMFPISLPFWLKWKSCTNRLHPDQHQLPERPHDCQPTQAAVSRSSHPKIPTLWQLCMLRFACCCWMLLNAENRQEPLWWRLWWRRRGNFCDCQRNWSVCDPRSCSCTNSAHSLCLESDWPVK